MWSLVLDACLIASHGCFCLSFISMNSVFATMRQSMNDITAESAQEGGELVLLWKNYFLTHDNSIELSSADLPEPAR